MRECQTCKICYTDEITVCSKDNSATIHTISGEPVLEGKYHLECRLGQGGMGVVYKARHAYLKTLHAIKIILPDLVGNDPQLVTRFRQEALAAAAIRHQNVVSVTDYGVAIGVMPFLVMEYVEGESLHDLLAREKRLTPENALELIAAIGAGVGAAHQEGIVHRDLKPLNVMILKDKAHLSEAVKILDFGLAKIKSGELLGSFIQAQTTGLMGSPYYMAPEQWNDEEPDARSDVYSLGVILFQMISGDVPFKGNSVPAIMKKHLTNDPPPFSDFDVNVDSLVELAILHTLEKDPEKRTQSVEQMIAELKHAVDSSQDTIPDYPASAPLPVSNLKILTRPAQSKVFVDNIAVGESKDDGWLLLEGVQSGNHHLRIRHEGFEDWEQSLTCDGSPVEVVAELKKDASAIPKPPEIVPVTIPPVEAVQESLPTQIKSQKIEIDLQKPAVQPQAKKPPISPVFLAVIGISGLFLLTAIGIATAFMLGAFGGPTGNTNSNGTNSPPANSTPGKPAEEVKPEMIKIPGGNFTMGRNDGDPSERPAHEIEVKTFWMDKTEVTNAEYYNFVQESKYANLPVDWENNKPLQGKEKMPVRYVNIDDVNAFIKWRSERDGVAYRLPNEEEWEYAARNGAKRMLYPWGDKYREECAVVGKARAEVEAVGSKECGANELGVQDLIGNVWEWTSGAPKPYPGSGVEGIGKPGVVYSVARGGSAYREKIGKVAETSTFRFVVPSDSRENRIGFRLVRSD
jgi:serine/threonine-protein kinase